MLRPAVTGAQCISIKRLFFFFFFFSASNLLVYEWAVGQRVMSSLSAAAVAIEPKQKSCTISLGLRVLPQMGQTCGGAGHFVHGGAVLIVDAVWQTSQHRLTLYESSAARSTYVAACYWLQR